MKQEIHPEYSPLAKVNCSCGNSWVTGSTKAEINVNICSACHPFYTGEQRIIDSVGRVERFVKRLESRQSAAARQQIESQAREESEVAARRARARGDDPEEAMAEVMSRYDLEVEAEEATGERQPKRQPKRQRSRKRERTTECTFNPAADGSN